MNLGQLGSCYIVGSEQTLQGNEIVAKVTWKAPFVSSTLLEATENLHQAYPQLKSIWSSDRFQWEQVSEPGFWDSYWNQEQSEILSPLSESQIFSQFQPSSQGLPFRIRILGPQETAFLINHAFANGLSTVNWISLWFQFYAECLESDSITPRPELNREDSCSSTNPSLKADLSLILKKTRPSLYLSALKLEQDLQSKKSFLLKTRAILWAMIYLAQFYLRWLWNRKPQTVDLSQGRTPDPKATRYFRKSYPFDERTTQNLIEIAKTTQTSLSELVCTEIVRALFEEQPDRNRICISIPADLRNILPGISLVTPGNFTCSLMAQVFRNESSQKSVRKIFTWLKRQTQFGIMQSFSTFTGPPQPLISHFHKQTLLPIPQRAPFEDFTLAYSNLGLIWDPNMDEFMEQMEIYGKTQTLFTALFTWAGKLNIQVCFSEPLFEKACFAAIDRAVLHLKKIKSASTDDHIRSP